MASDYPSRIVCLSAEAVEILYRLGCGDRIVGITGYATHPPEARSLPRVSGFSEVNYEKVDALRPDLVITFSDVQAECAHELIRRGHVVLATNQRSLEDIFCTILLIGRIVGHEPEAQKLANEMRAEIFGSNPVVPPANRPAVYFEEWDDPMISAIAWVSELIEAAGGRDIFADRRENPRATDRTVTAEEIIHRQPEIIIASWCGKKARLDTIRQREGWGDIPAVCNHRIYEIPSTDILQPGPGLLRGLTQLRNIIALLRPVQNKIA
ncbi:MAG: cobalamin-binding protein [Chthoniobacteraceae bacterium]